MKCVGIVGGLSPESTVTYYRTILRRHHEATGDQCYPRVVIASVSFGAYAAWQHAGDWDAIARGIDGELRALARAGADFAVLATNTMHKVLPSTASELPVLSVLDVVAEAARARNLRRLGLTGTRFTMEDPFYADALRARGVEVVVPSPAERAEVHRIIYDELTLGRIEPSSVAAFDAAAARLVAAGADAVLLGCTELELLLRGRAVDYPSLDTADLHATRAWEVATGRAPMPGGPDGGGDASPR